MIYFDQVSKVYPAGNIVLDNVSFHIGPGEFVVLTGTSGAGKTTIGRLLIKEILPTSGVIQVDNQDLKKIKDKDLPALRRKIGLVFQDYKIIPDKTVHENIALALEIINFPHKEIDNRVKHLLDLVGIPDKAQLFPSQLSGGELQRAAIARAIVPEPKILFADEPTGNLDEKTAEDIYGLLKAIHDLGTTVIMSTHNPAFLAKGHRHLHLEKGKITKDSKVAPEDFEEPDKHKKKKDKKEE